MSRLGADAETGTQPLSAPHTPLNVSISRLAARIDCSATSGVPLMSMPRTSSLLAVGVQPVRHHRVDLERLRRERRGVR